MRLLVADKSGRALETSVRGSLKQDEAIGTTGHRLKAKCPLWTFGGKKPPEWIDG